MSKQQPEALRLANKLDFEATTADMGRPPEKNSTKRLAAVELRRLHDFEEQHRAIDECWIREIAAFREQRDALLEALNACLEKGKRWHPCDPVVLAARAAIAKATGGRA